MSIKNFLKHKKFPFLVALFLCSLFFVAYSVLAIVRYEHYESFGFDLGINNQVVWEYSRFKAPVTTIDHIPNISKLFVHVEFIYALISPLYWLWSDTRMLIIAEVFVVTFSSIAIFLLARFYKLHIWVQYALLLSYLLFYGVQNALWFGVHSATFGASFVSWFLYFLVSSKNKLTLLFFILAITSKENVAGITFLIATVQFFVTRTKVTLLYMLLSLIYLGFIFGIYFPQVVPDGYRFENPDGLLSTLDPLLMVNSKEKLDVYIYTFLTYGFLPLLHPLYLLPALGNVASYFILGSNVTTAQGLFLQYRIELVPLISWSAIEAIKKYKWLHTRWIAVYLIIFAVLVQYLLHLPLSYLTKSWFWTEPSGVKSINTVVKKLRVDDAIAAQNNIIPHISQREQIYTLYPEKKSFLKNSPCGKQECDWFRWHVKSRFVLVDTSHEWDTRHLLTNNEAFITGLKNIEKAGIVRKKEQKGTTILYEIVSPSH